MTPHISAKSNQIAKVVLMPGDPLRAKWIAKKYLKDFELVNEVRGMLGYTGYYNNKRITVFAHGMGIPSVGIYSYELYNFYKVNTIIRIGTCGSYNKELNVGDLVVTKDIVCHSRYAQEIGVQVNDNIITTETKILNTAINTAKDLNLKINQVRVACSDVFYNRYTLAEQIEMYKNPDVIEMESFALYANAIKLNRNAICLLTVSDSFITKKEMSSIERQTSMDNMVKLGLELA